MNIKDLRCGPVVTFGPHNLRFQGASVTQKPYWGGCATPLDPVLDESRVFYDSAPLDQSSIKWGRWNRNQPDLGLPDGHW